MAQPVKKTVVILYNSTTYKHKKLAANINGWAEFDLLIYHQLPYSPRTTLDRNSRATVQVLIVAFESIPLFSESQKTFVVPFESFQQKTQHYI
ncbi:MAG: hypothetical protein WC951_10650 [Bacteroidales bacterium]